MNPGWFAPIGHTKTRLPGKTRLARENHMPVVYLVDNFNISFDILFNFNLINDYNNKHLTLYLFSTCSMLVKIYNSYAEFTRLDACRLFDGSFDLFSLIFFLSSN